MAAHLTGSGAIVPQDGVAEHVHALMDLSEAAYAIRAHSSSQARDRLHSAVSRVLRMFRLHGVAAVPLMSRYEAAETFRQALRLARTAGVPHHDLVAIFQGEEEPGDPGRKDLL